MELKFNKNLSKIQTSKIRQFDAYCNQFKNVIKLTLGQPLFPTPSPIKAKAIEAINKNITYYTPNRGNQATIETVQKYCKQHFNLEYGLDEIIMGIGTTEVLASSLATILNEGDEVILPAPAYSGYEPLVYLNDCTVKYVDTVADNFQLTVENLKKHITPKTKCVLITDPSNPTGASLSRKNRDELAAFLATTDIFLIADEVYNRIVYTDDYMSFGNYPELRKQLIIVNSFSKSHSMTGWRLGWVMADKEVINEMAKVHQYYVTAASSIGQYGLLAILDPQTEKEIAQMVKEYRDNMIYACDFLTKLGFECKRTQGAFYLYFSTKPFGMDGDTFAKRLVEETGVAMVPGNAFGKEYDDYVRISYCVDTLVLKECLTRIERFVSKL
jgi:aminotransferase